MSYLKSNLGKLFSSEKEYRENGNYTECLETCLKILSTVWNNKEEKQYDILSKLFLYPDQSYYVKIGLLNGIIKKINETKNDPSIKTLYYQLFLNSLNSIQSTDNELEKIKKLLEKSNSKNFNELDKYISEISSLQQPEKSSDSINSKSKTLQTFLTSNDNNFNNFSDLIKNEHSSQTGLNILGDESLSRSDINSTVHGMLTENMINYTKNLENEQRKYKPNNKLPMVILSISINLNSNQFLNLINNTFYKLFYKKICNIKQNKNECVYIYQYSPNNCCEKIKYCIANKKYIKNQFQVIALLQKEDDKYFSGANSFLNDNYERKISIKSIKGHEKNLKIFLVKFLNIFCSNANKIKIYKQSKCLLSYNLEKNINSEIRKRKISLYKNYYLPKGIANTVNINNSSAYFLQETLVEKSNNKANKYYELFKILSSNEYGLGVIITKFISDFKIKYNDIIKISKPGNIDTRSIMSDIVKLIEYSTNTLNSSYNNFQNYGLTYYSLASEQFIFNKIYYMIYDIYSIEYNKVNEDFIKNQIEINENLSINEIFTSLGIQKKFRGEEEIPYKDVIECINKIPLEKIPKKKLEVITQSSIELRSCILNYTNGKSELDSMDDELPIVLYISTQIKVKNIAVELYMVDDYIKCSLGDDLVQNKMITNLMGSLFFITKNWDKNGKKFNL